MSKNDKLGELMRQMVVVPIEMLGTLLDLVHKLLGNDGQKFFRELKKFVLKQQCWADGLISWFSNITLLATTEKFVVQNKFVIYTTNTAQAKISGLGDNFKNWFLGKTEELAGEVSIRYGDLTESANDEKILAELGGEAKAETTLSAIYVLMLKQPNRRKGYLLSNGYANIFYVRDVNGVLRAVSVAWFSDYWRVDAHPIDVSDVWNAGHRVFSRN